MKGVISNIKMALKDWKFKKVDKWRDLWTNKTKWIIVDKVVHPIYNYKYKVVCSDIINIKNTINGHFKFFKTKQTALKFARAYMRKH
jgi:hypothetical protein